MARRKYAKTLSVQNAYRPCPQPSECRVEIPGLDAYKCATCGQWREVKLTGIREQSNANQGQLQSSRTLDLLQPLCFDYL
jgi:hypothetical protein